MDFEDDFGGVKLFKNSLYKKKKKKCDTGSINEVRKCSTKNQDFSFKYSMV